VTVETEGPHGILAVAWMPGLGRILSCGSEAGTSTPALPDTLERCAETRLTERKGDRGVLWIHHGLSRRSCAAKGLAAAWRAAGLSRPRSVARCGVCHRNVGA
jgi:hypothetical protein